MLYYLRKLRIPALFVYPSIALLLGLTACQHIEPQRFHGKQARIGDKAWNLLHPWYKTRWNDWQKLAYWAGPGHSPVFMVFSGTADLIISIFRGPREELPETKSPCSPENHTPTGSSIASKS